MITNLPKTEVKFVISAETEKGKGLVVGVVGSSESLGSWQVRDALILHTNPETYPVWSGHVYIDINSVVEYKYVLLLPSSSSPSGYKLKQWESHFNRKLTVTGLQMAVEDGTFGSDKQQIFIDEGWQGEDFQLRFRLESSFKRQDNHLGLTMKDESPERLYKACVIPKNVFLLHVLSKDNINLYLE